LEEEAEERNLQRSPSYLEALYTKWLCKKKGCKNFPNGGYCYFTDPETHVEFDLMDANSWDRAIRKGDATLDTPTTALLTSMTKKNHRLTTAQSFSRRSGVAGTNPSFSTTNHNHFYFGELEKLQQQARDQVLGTKIPSISNDPSTPYAKNASYEPIPSSPIAAASDAEEEVSRYFDCLIQSEKGLSVRRMLERAKEKMLEHGIKISQIRKLRDDQLEKMDITEIGIQMSIRDGIRAFKRGTETPL
jgi:hypothetical protein